MRKQSDVVENYINNVIKCSWTWERLTDEERERFLNLRAFNIIRGNDAQRIEWAYTIYAAFLAALNYNWCGWRENNE